MEAEEKEVDPGPQGRLESTSEEPGGRGGEVGGKHWGVEQGEDDGGQKDSFEVTVSKEEEGVGY